MATKTAKGFIDKNGDKVIMKPAAHNHQLGDIEGFGNSGNNPLVLSYDSMGVPALSGTPNNALLGEISESIHFIQIVEYGDYQNLVSKTLGTIVRPIDHRYNTPLPITVTLSSGENFQYIDDEWVYLSGGAHHWDAKIQGLILGPSSATGSNVYGTGIDAKILISNDTVISTDGIYEGQNIRLINSGGDILHGLVTGCLTGPARIVTNIDLSKAEYNSGTWTLEVLV